MSYNDPKTTRPGAGRGSGRTIWIVVAALVVLLLLAWMVGLFGGGETPVTDVGDPAITTTDPAVDPVVTDPVAPAPDPVVPADPANTPAEPGPAPTPGQN